MNLSKILLLKFGQYLRNCSLIRDLPNQFSILRSLFLNQLLTQKDLLKHRFTREKISFDLMRTFWMLEFGTKTTFIMMLVSLLKKLLTFLTWILMNKNQWGTPYSRQKYTMIIMKSCMRGWFMGSWISLVILVESLK